MIEIYCNIEVNHDAGDPTQALCKLITAYAYLNWPLVITDTWYADGQLMPADVVHAAMRKYQRTHPRLPNGITLLTHVCKKPGEHQVHIDGDPSFQNMLSDLVRSAVNGPDEHPEYRQDKFKLVHTAPSKGTQAEEFAKMREQFTEQPNGLHDYFNVVEWKWDTDVNIHLRAGLAHWQHADD